MDKNYIVDCMNDECQSSLDWNFGFVEVEGVKYGIKLIKNLDTIDEFKLEIGYTIAYARAKAQQHENMVRDYNRLVEYWSNK